MEYQSKLKFLINLAFYLSVGVIVFICARFLLGYFLPILISVLIASVVQKPAEKIASRLKLSSGKCAALLSAFLFILVACVLYFLIYMLFTNAGSFLNELNGITDYFTKIFVRLKTALNGIFKSLPAEISDMLLRMGESLLESLLNGVTNFFSTFATSVATKMPSFLFSTVIALVASCYIAKDYKILSKFIKELLGENLFSKILKIRGIFTDSIFKIIKGYFLLMLLTFIELFIGFLILGINHSLLIAILVALVDLLPVFGTGTVLIPWGFILLLSDNSKGFGILILYIIITLARNFIEPKIIGKQIGINPLFTLIVMFAGLKIIGFWGIFIFPIVFIVTIKYYKD